MWRKWDDLEEKTITIMYFLFVPPSFGATRSFMATEEKEPKASSGGEVERWCLNKIFGEI